MRFNVRYKLLVASAAFLWPGHALLCADPVPAASAAPVRPQAPEINPANYELSPGDTVAITVFREPDLTTQQRLSRDGTVNLPLLGVVPLAGKNTTEGAALIASMLSKGYLIHPQVSMSVVDVARIKFTVLGQVSTPGAFDVPADQSIDILAAIARAGGFTRLANPSNVLVRRTTNGQEETFKLDVKRLMNDKKSPRFPIRSNDTISVGERLF
jgi:polysaccharide export outer membrane protein